MKKNDLKKIYKFDLKNETFYLEVQLENYHNAYSDWDFSPFVNRDLDKDLTEYLLDCSYEITLKNNLLIIFYILSQSENKNREDRSVIGIHNYFKYQLRKLKNQRLRVYRDISTNFLIGGLLLMTSTYLKTFFTSSLLFTVFLEGLFIGGWVMFWEMFSAFFFDMKNVRLKEKHYLRLNNVAIKYIYGRKGEV